MNRPGAGILLRSGCLFSVLLAFCSFASLHAVPAGDYAVFVQVDRGLSPQEVELLKVHGVTGYLVDVENRRVLDAVRNFPLIVGGIADTGHVALPQEEFDRYFDAYLRQRLREQASKPYCFNRGRPTIVLAARERGREAVEYNPVALSLVDQPSVTRGDAPFDFCLCKGCIHMFREDLKERWGDDLSEAQYRLGVPFASWEEVVPWSVDEVRARNELRSPSLVNLAPWMAHRAFMDRTFSEALVEMGEAASEGSEDVKAGFLGGHPPNAFGGHDWSRLSANDLLLPPDDATTWSIIRSRSREGCLVLSEVATAEGDDRRVIRRLGDQVVQGFRGVLIRSPEDLLESAPDGNPQATAFLTQLSKLLTVLRRGVVPALDQATPPSPKVGVIHSMPSLRLLWLRDTADDGIFWPTRTRERKAGISPLANCWSGWRLMLDDLGLTHRSLSEADLLADDDRLASLRVIILPRVNALSTAAAVRLRRFVEDGGLVLADGETGLYDELGRGRPCGVLDGLFGVTRSDPPGRAWDIPPFERNEERTERLGLRELEPFVSVDGGVNGAHYLNLDLADYVGQRIHEPDSVEPLLQQMDDLLRSFGVYSPVEVFDSRGSPYARVRRELFHAPSGDLLALVPNVPIGRLKAGEEARDIMELRIELPEPRLVNDLVRGTKGESPMRVLNVSLPTDLIGLYRLREP